MQSLKHILAVGTLLILLVIAAQAQAIILYDVTFGRQRPASC
jgi:hypothetical protein